MYNQNTETHNGHWYFETNLHIKRIECDRIIRGKTKTKRWGEGRKGRNRMLPMTPKLLLLLAMGLFEVVGNASSDITFNFWLDAFPDGAANFTILYLSALFYFLLVVPLTVAWFIWRRHDRGPRRFLRERRLANAGMLTVTALCDVFIDVFGTYAAGHVPIVIQLVLKSSEPLVCWAMTAVLWRRRHGRWLDLLFPFAAFAACAAGLTAEMWISLEHSEEKEHQGFWIAVFGLRVLCSAGYNVSQAKFLRDNAESFRPDDALDEGSTRQHHRKGFSSRLLLNFISLSGDFAVSLVFYTCLGPLVDTIKFDGWGSSSSVRQAWASFGAGARCVGSPALCPNNLTYAVVTNLAWCFVYIADTFLNELCPALNSMVNMLSGPLAALIVIAVPALSLGEASHSSTKNAVLQLAALAFLVLGLVLFAIYERRTSAKDENGTRMQTDPLGDLTEGLN